MTTSWKIRSSLLALVAVMALISGCSVTADNGTTAPDIEGTWLVTVTIPNGPPPFPSLVTYARGGALLATDSSVAPASGNVYQGTWVKTGSQTFAFTFWGFQYDAGGALTNYIRAHEDVQLEPGGGAYNGATKIEILDLERNVVTTDSSTTHGVRVVAR